MDVSTSDSARAVKCQHCGKVSKRMRCCPGCEKNFCSAECRREDWTLHKHFCPIKFPLQAPADPVTGKLSINIAIYKFLVINRSALLLVFSLLTLLHPFYQNSICELFYELKMFKGLSPSRIMPKLSVSPSNEKYQRCTIKKQCNLYRR